MNPKLLGLLEGRAATLDTHPRGEGRGEGAVSTPDRAVG